jgi:hypothetical protein
MLKNLALAVAATAVGVALVEVGVRIFAGPIRYHRTHIGESLHFDPHLGFRELPHFETTSRDERGPFELRFNADGFRGRPLPAEPEPASAGVERIAFLGDSFLVASAVREGELMTTRTERALRERGRQIEVYSLAASDYGTAQQLLLLRRTAQRLGPDAVVLVLYPPNDLANNALELAGRTHVSPGDYLRPYLVSDGHGALIVRYAHPRRAALRRVSRTFALLESRLLAGVERRDLRWLEIWPKPLSQIERARRYWPPVEAQEIYRRHDLPQRWERAWDATFELLRALADETRALGARLLILVVPGLEQVQRDALTVRFDVGFRKVTGRGLEALLDWNLPERRLAGWFAGQEIDARLLLAPLRDAVRAGDGVYSPDAHLNARGHEIAAAFVTQWYLGAEPSPVEPPTGLPVRLLPAAQAAEGRLDFRSTTHSEYLSGGFLSRRSGTSGELGWTIAERAGLVLPARGGDLVVRGEALPSLPTPVSVTLGIEGGRRQSFPIDAHGPLTLRLERRLTRALPSGYVVVYLEIEGLDPVARRRPGLLIQQVGFERPSEGAPLKPNRPQPGAVPHDRTTKQG